MSERAERPVVSVIVPVGRADAELEAQLAALAQQSFSGFWELVLAVNTAVDHEVGAVHELAAQHPFARVVDASAVRSAAFARNAGADAAHAELLAFCDGDDLVETDWLATLVGAMEPGVALGGHLAEERLAVPRQENWRPPATPGALPTFMGQPYLVSANMAVWRDDFRGAGGFDLTLVRGEDIALSFSLIRNGVELRYAPDAIVHYRHRRGLRKMLHQHYLYGRGMAQVLARVGVPGDQGGRGIVGAMRPNAQAVDSWSVPHVLRKLALGIGRAVGTLQERARRR